MGPKRRASKRKREEEPSEKEKDEKDFVPSKRKGGKANKKASKEAEEEDGFGAKLKSLLENGGNHEGRGGMKIKSRNVLTTINGAANGRFRRGISDNIEEKARVGVLNYLRSFSVYKSASPFDRRATALAWHPSHTSLFAVGDKSGSLVLWNYENEEEIGSFIYGKGPGGSIQSIKFHPDKTSWVYTCSIDGTMALKDLTLTEGNENLRVFQASTTLELWYTSFDISFSNNLLVFGDNKGLVSLMTPEGNDRVWSKKLHKGKVHDIRFSPREPWLFVSTSIDKSVKVWDIRCVKDKEPLAQILHNKPVNSAVFNSVNGTRILTTDQHSELRVYAAPHWTCQNIIPHPHRQFQHLTPIIASWHPLVDLIVVGRYPDPKFPGYNEGEARSIDIIDADTGKIEYQMAATSDNRIASLNQFNPTGEALLSCMAGTVCVWKPSPWKLCEDGSEKPKYEKKQMNNFSVEKWPESRSKSDQKNTKKKAKAKSKNKEV